MKNLPRLICDSAISNQLKPSLLACLIILQLLITNTAYSEKSKEAQLAPIEFNLGPLGAKATTQVGKNTFTITKLTKGNPAYAAGLKIGDQIVAAQGKTFVNADNKIDNGGIGPLEGLGYAIDKAEATGQLNLSIIRNQSKQEITVKLKKVGAFAKNYPYNCPKSLLYYNGICNHLVKSQRKDGSWKSNTGLVANQVTTSICALALLGRGDERLMPAIKKAKNYLIKSMAPSQYLKSSLNNWAMVYSGIFLSEYYLATNDKTALPHIKKFAYELARRQNIANGSHGHHADPINSGYKGSGLNIITTGVMWYWALAEKCGVKIPQKNWNLAMNHIHHSTSHKGSNKGGVRYVRGASGYADASGRTGNMALALYVAQQKLPWANEMTAYLTKHTKRMRECHANGSLGMISGTMALGALDAKGFRKHMDYWRWYVTLSRSPENKAYYIGSKRNNGGDHYLNKSNIMQGLMGLMLATSQKRLYSLGGYPAIADLQLNKLSKKNKKAFLNVKDKKYKQALSLLNAQINDTKTKSSDKSDAKKIQSYVYKISKQKINAINQQLTLGDVYLASLEQKEFSKLFGSPKDNHPDHQNYKKIIESLKSEPVKKSITVGKKYHLGLSRMQSKPRQAEHYFKQILAKPKIANAYYLKMAKLQLQALQDKQSKN